MPPKPPPKAPTASTSGNTTAPAPSTNTDPDGTKKPEKSFEQKFKEANIRLNKLESITANHRASITTLEQAMCDRSIQIRDLPMETSDGPETTKKLLHNVWENVFKFLKIKRNDVYIDAIYRLGTPQDRADGRFAIPSIRITFVTTADRHLVLGRLSQANPANKTGKWQILNDNPKILKKQVALAHNVAWKYRTEKDWECKTKINVRAGRISIMVKFEGDPWVYLPSDDLNRLQKICKAEDEQKKPDRMMTRLSKRQEEDQTDNLFA